MFKFKNNSKGFTLIELLVVIAIIGILSSVVIASLNSARKKGRDVRRVEDIKSIQLALELYYDENGSYPSATSALVTGGHIPVVPVDPGASTPAYTYVQLSSGSSYHLGANLETAGHSALNSDSDATDSDGAGADFDGASGTCSTSTGTDSCYDVKP